MQKILGFHKKCSFTRVIRDQNPFPYTPPLSVVTGCFVLLQLQIKIIAEAFKTEIAC